MATSKKFSELPVASSMNNGDLFAVAQEDAQAETGYTSKSATALVVGKKLNGEIEYATDLPSFPPGDQNPLDALEYLNSKINDLYPVDSASGAIANFTTSLALPLVALKAYIKAQGGGGTPTTPIAITGWDKVNVTRAGVNIFGGEVLADTIVSKVPNATKDTINKTVSYLASNVTTVVLFDKFNANTQYTFYLSATSTVTNLIIEYTDGTKTPAMGSIAPNTFVTSTAGKSIKALKGIYHTGTSILKYDECGIFLGTVNSFTPYNATTFTLPLGQTIYGGYVDWKLGKLVVTHKYADLSQLSYTIRVTGTTKRLLSFSLPDNYIGKNLVKLNWLCSTALYIDSSSFTLLSADVDSDEVGIYSFRTTGETNVAYIVLDDITATTFSGQLVYELATPIVTDITLPDIVALVGEQNIFADTGNIDVSFKMGVQEYIDKKIAEVQALVL